MSPGAHLRLSSKRLAAWAPLILLLVFLLLQSTFLGHHTNQRRPNHPNRRHQNVIFVASELLPSSSGTSSAPTSTSSSHTENGNSYEQQSPEDSKCEQDELSQLLLKRFNYLFSQEEKTNQLLAQLASSECTNSTTGGGGGGGASAAPLNSPEQTAVGRAENSSTGSQSPLDQRTTATGTSGNSDDSKEQQRQLLPKRKYFRVLNRVFSRVELPEIFKRPSNGQLSRSTSSSSNVPSSSQNQLPNSSSSSSSSSSPPANNHCALHIGCIDELPNFPSLLKLKPNVSATFTVYSSSSSSSSQATSGQPTETTTAGEPANKRAHQRHGGQRIVYEPVMHYKLEESSLASVQSESELESEALKLLRQQQMNKLLVENQLMSAGHHPNHKNKSTSSSISSSSSSGLSRLNRRNSLQKNNKHNRLLGGGPQPLSLLGSADLLPVANRLQIRGAHQQQQQQLRLTGWKSAVKIAHSLELPFDLSQLEQVNFNSSLTTRVIIGGYFAKEDEEWIDELVRQWLLLEPCNVIKVSWQDSNRGLYHTAAYNSRIVGRQLSLFLHYLNELHSIDLEKFHLVGHSLGAHIAGFVGHDNDGRIARITGLDPAGPIFFELQAPWRLDPSDAQFVDVMHTNGGTITKGALGLAVPSGHVDYYCNGGSLQPGCYFSSVTKSIMDPVERVACNHRRSYRYFTELTKLAIATNNNSSSSSSSSSSSLPSLGHTHNQKLAKFPQAFLFQVAKQDDLVRLVQPEINLIGGAAGGPGSRQEDEAPLKWRIEFHSLRPSFPKNKRGLYFFRTRSEAPFFSSRQFAITIRSEQVVKKKLALMAKINNSLVAEVELDELNGSYSFLFAPQDPHLIDAKQVASGQVPDLWLMWRQRSFNLLLGQQNELYLSSIELNLIDDFYFDQQQQEQTNGHHSSSGQSAATTTSTLSDLIEHEPDGADQQLIMSMARNANTTSSDATATAAAAAAHQVFKIVRYLNGNTNNQLDSILKTTSLSGHFALARNQWHKFEGKLEEAPTATSSTRRRKKRRRR